MPLPVIVYLDFLAPPFLFNGGHIRWGTKHSLVYILQTHNLVPIFSSLAQWPTTTFPICRLPVFIIGVLAGLQSPDDPLPSSNFLIFPSYGSRKSESDKDAEESQWAQKIDAILCLILLGVIGGWISVLYFPSNQFFNFYFQLLGVHLLLTIMLGLTKVELNIMHLKRNCVRMVGVLSSHQCAVNLGLSGWGNTPWHSTSAMSPSGELLHITNCFPTSGRLDGIGCALRQTYLWL